MNTNTLLLAHGQNPEVKGHCLLPKGAPWLTGRAVVDVQEAQDGKLIFRLLSAKATLAFVEAARAPNDGTYWGTATADRSRTAHRSGWTTAAHDSGWTLLSVKR